MALDPNLESDFQSFGNSGSGSGSSNKLNMIQLIITPLVRKFINSKFIVGGDHFMNPQECHIECLLSRRYFWIKESIGARVVTDPQNCDLQSGPPIT